LFARWASTMRRNRVFLVGFAARGVPRQTETDFSHSGSTRVKSYGMNAAPTPFQRHERGIHAVSAGPGRPTGAGWGEVGHIRPG
jgi:hypothetical protein